MEKFKDVEYLKVGNLKQKQSYKILKNIKIFKILEEFNPILVGTIPIGVDVDKSDLDIVCEINLKNKDSLKNISTKNFSQFKNFKIINTFSTTGVIVINFFVDDMEIEIYASKVSSFETNGYRHMIIEERIFK